MQQAIPYRTWAPTATTSYRRTTQTSSATDARKLAAENAVIVFGRRGCCMCHVVKRLLLGLGVNPAVHEVDEGVEGELVSQLQSLAVVDLNQQSGTEHGEEAGEALALPAVFVGGRLFGGLDRVMATHISGELVPVLKQVGALWL
uniref:Glutaredoxin domain-containing protein n=1 Tax=Kalanchoe fedtschenkoi TaxID=63787 RepID=A0A7N0RFG2_KALFE